MPEAEEIVRRRIADGYTDLLFPYDRQKWSNKWASACRRLGIIDLHGHGLRHYALTELARMGLNEFELRQFSGHENAMMLSVYVNPRPVDIHAKLQRNAIDIAAKNFRN